MYIEATHMRPHDRQILLNLGGDARLGQPAAPMRALIREGDVDPFVDRGWRLAVRMSPVSAPGATSAAAAAPPAPLSKTAPPDVCRRARRLQRASSARCPAAADPDRVPAAPLLLQLVTIAPQLLALSLQPRVVLTESFRFSVGLLDLTPQSLQFTLRVIARAKGRALRHARVMADSRKKYKPRIWIRVVNPLTSYDISSSLSART
jgi:hypothetical protein